MLPCFSFTLTNSDFSFPERKKFPRNFSALGSSWVPLLLEGTTSRLELSPATAFCPGMFSKVAASPWEDKTPLFLRCWGHAGRHQRELWSSGSSHKSLCLCKSPAEGGGAALPAPGAVLNWTHVCGLTACGGAEPPLCQPVGRLGLAASGASPLDGAAQARCPKSGRGAPLVARRGARDFWAAPGTGQLVARLGAEVCVGGYSSGCSSPTKARVLQRSSLSFCPGFQLSILPFASQEDFGGGGGELISIVQRMEVTCFVARENEQSLLCAGSFSTAVSRLNTVTSRVSKVVCGTFLPSSQQICSCYLAVGCELCDGNGQSGRASPALREKSIL